MDLKSVLQSLRNPKTKEDNGSVSDVDVQYNERHRIAGTTHNEVFSVNEITSSDFDLEDDEIFQSIDLYNFSNTSIGDGNSSVTTPIIGDSPYSRQPVCTFENSTKKTTPTNKLNKFKFVKSSRPVSKTGWTSSDEPINKRPLNEVHPNSSHLLPVNSSTIETSIKPCPLNEIHSNSSHLPSVNSGTTVTTAKHGTTSLHLTPSQLPQSTPSCNILSTHTPCFLTTPTSHQYNPQGTTIQRKFPGPAGCLPQLDTFENMDSIRIPAPATPRPASTPRVKRFAVGSSEPRSQDVYNNNEFTCGPWMAMMKELDLSDSLSACLLSYTIANTLKQATKRQLTNGKVPHLRALLKTLVPSTRSASAVLKDPTGDIVACVHTQVLDYYKEVLVPGCAIILRQVSILSPSPRKHYLNITLDNIVRVYSPNKLNRTTGPLRLSDFEQQYQTIQSSLQTTPCMAPFLTSQHATSQPQLQSSQHLSSEKNSLVIQQSCFSNDIEDDFDAFFENIDVSVLDL